MHPVDHFEGKITIGLVPIHPRCFYRLSDPPLLPSRLPYQVKVKAKERRASPDTRIAKNIGVPLRDTHLASMALALV